MTTIRNGHIFISLPILNDFDLGKKDQLILIAHNIFNHDIKNKDHLMGLFVQNGSIYKIESCYHWSDEEETDYTCSRQGEYKAVDIQETIDDMDMTNRALKRDCEILSLKNEKLSKELATCISKDLFLESLAATNGRKL